MSAARSLARAPASAYLLALVLVALMTWLLVHVQTALIVHAGYQYVRPFGIGYVVPIALIAALGGYRAGLLTLVLSLLAAMYFLTPTHLTFALHDTLDMAELVSLGLVGGLIVAGGEAMRRNAALLSEKRQAAERQQQLLRDVLASVTDNRLHLCNSRAELPPCLMPVGEPVSLSADDLRTLRERVCETVLRAGFSDERCYDLMTAASEAAMNAVVHGGGGEGRVCVKADDTVQVWVEDRGRGIAMDQLPRAALERGHSTAGTLGHGFWLMLKTADRLWLVTGETGTTVVLEQERLPPEPIWV